jgi:hypothetical protein
MDRDGGRTIERTLFSRSSWTFVCDTLLYAGALVRQLSDAVDTVEIKR